MPGWYFIGRDDYFSTSSSEGLCFPKLAALWREDFLGDPNSFLVLTSSINFVGKFSSATAMVSYNYGVPKILGSW